MNKYTYTQIEELVLDLLYVKNQERPLWVTASEIYWSINDPNISERDVIETLEKFVKERRVLKQVGKYQIDKLEFLEIKKRKEDEAKMMQENSESLESLQSLQADKHSQIKTKKSMRWFHTITKFVTWLLWMSIGVILGFLFYNIFLQHRYTIADINIPTSEILQEKKPIIVVTRTETDIKRSVRKIGTELNKQQEIDKQLIEQTDSLRQSLKNLTAYLQKSEEQRIDRLREHQNSFLIGLCVALTLMLIILGINIAMKNK